MSAICQDKTLSAKDGLESTQRQTLLLLALHPPPNPIQAFHVQLNVALKEAFEQLQVGEYIQLYEPSNLHVTICTLCQRLNPDSKSSSAMKQIARSWASATSGSLETTNLELRKRGAMFDDGVGVLLWTDGAVDRVEKWRSALRMIKPEVDSNISAMYKDQNENIPVDMSRFSTPNIIHSTVLRWKQASPAHVTVAQARKIFEQAVIDTWHKHTYSGDNPLVVPIRQLQLVEEKSPCLSKVELHRLVELKSN